MRRLMLAILTIALALAMSTTAPGASRPQQIQYSAQSQTGDGYRFEVYGYKLGRRERVGLQVFRSRRHSYLSTTYTTRGVRTIAVGRHGMESGLGTRGAVRLRFDRQRTLPEPDACGATVQLGTLEGRLRFRGEGGYTRVLAHRLSGRRLLGGRAGCVVFGHRAVSSARREPSLLACGGPSVFSATADAFRGRNFFDAHSNDVGRGLRTEHRAIKLARSGFTYSEDLESAAVTPGRPFKGTGTFADTGLRGDLRFRTPGTNGIPLTPLKATFARGGASTTCGVLGPTSRPRTPTANLEAHRAISLRAAVGPR